MPAEPSQSKLKRRSSRKDLEDSLRFDGGHAREIELKRNRGEISCAECRRLKIKCDKQIPCQSCQRRGCASLCPNGSLATGQGTRFVLAATEHLHRKISKMSERIRNLEDALGNLHARHSSEPHPLLRDELLSTNTERDDDAPAGEDAPAPAHPPEVMEAFGTLSISDHGISRFFGPTGGSESLLMSENTSTSSPPLTQTSGPSLRESNSPSLPGDLTFFSQSFPFTPMGPASAVQKLIEGHLPAWERASSLAETYLEQAAWLFHGVSRTQLIEEMLPTFYKREVAYPSEDYSGPHDLALIFMVFAVGALVDLEQEPSNAEAEHYHQIARAAICLQPVLEKPSLVTIQTLHLLSIYNAMSGNEVNGNETSMETSWSLITLAAHLSQTIGLHRDSARWGLSPRMVQRRRVLFWDMFLADAWQSLNTGRPPSFSLAYVDCRFPQADEKGGSEQKSDEPGYESWGFRFASECVAEVAARTLTAESPSYATIMELDRKVREFPIPEQAAAFATSKAPSLREEPLSLSASMQLCVMSHTREVILLYIHRSFFAQAIIEHPTNPLRSPYAPSFLAAYRASSTILKCIRDQFAVEPNLCARFWSMWTFAFSAAVVFGTVVTRGPRSPLASAAMTELEQACLLFSKAASHSRRAAKALPILTRLGEKAHVALSAAQNEPSSAGLNGSQWNIKQDDENDELSIFAGRTRFVSSAKRPSPSGSSAPSLKQTTPPYVPPPSNEPYSISSSTNSFSEGHTPPSAMPDTWAVDRRLPDFLSVSSNNQQSSSVPQYPTQYQLSDHASLPSGSHINYSWGGEPNVVQQHYQISAQYTVPAQVDSFQNAYQSQVYATTPAFRGPHLSHPPPSELADLGLASRDSRLDEKWASFMEDSGLLEGIGFRS